MITTTKHEGKSFIIYIFEGQRNALKYIINSKKFILHLNGQPEKEINITQILVNDKALELQLQVHKDEKLEKQLTPEQAKNKYLKYKLKYLELKK